MLIHKGKRWEGNLVSERRDQDLVLAVLAGDKRAFGELAERHNIRARRAAMPLVGNYDIACELVQEALLQAYLGLATLREPAHFGAWLVGIIRNVCRTYLRDQRTQRTVALQELIDQLEIIQAVDPAAVLEERERTELVHHAIAALSHKNQAATWLFYMEALSIEEIAALLDASPNAVKGRLFQARKQLRAELTPFFAPVFTPALSPTKASVALQERKTKMAKISVVKLLQNASDNQILYLLDTTGLRYLSLWIGPYEAEQIQLHLTGKPSARPLTYRYFAEFLTVMGLQLEAVRVARLHETTFYAISQFRNGDLVKELDARPSDAIGLALHTGSPIFVDAELMAQQGEPLPESLDLDAWFAAEVARVQAERLTVAAWQAEFFKTVDSRFTPTAQSVFQQALTLVQQFGLNYVGTEHLLWGLVHGQGGNATVLLQNAGMTKIALAQAIIARTGPLPQLNAQGEFIAIGTASSTMSQPLVPRVIEVIKLADTMREQTQARQISAEHLLLGILREGGGMAVTLLQDLGVDLAELERQAVETAC